ncbi:ccr4 associated factor, partial [Cladochytrium tenue]
MALVLTCAGLPRLEPFICAPPVWPYDKNTFVSVERREWMKYMRKVKEYDAKKLGVVPGSRGVVLTGSSKSVPNIITAVLLLRETGCNLPVQFSYIRREVTEEDLYTIRSFNISTHDFTDAIKNNDWGKEEFRLGGPKIDAILATPFEEVLFLDPDNYVLKDPTYLFDTRVFKKFGALFWPDFPVRPNDTELIVWDIFNLKGKYWKEFEFESGQLVLDKSRSDFYDDPNNPVPQGYVPQPLFMHWNMLKFKVTEGVDYFQSAMTYEVPAGDNRTLADFRSANFRVHGDWGVFAQCLDLRHVPGLLIRVWQYPHLVGAMVDPNNHTEQNEASSEEPQFCGQGVLLNGLPSSTPPDDNTATLKGLALQLSFMKGSYDNNVDRFLVQYTYESTDLKTLRSFPGVGTQLVEEIGQFNNCIIWNAVEGLSLRRHDIGEYFSANEEFREVRRLLPDEADIQRLKLERSLSLVSGFRHDEPSPNGYWAWLAGSKLPITIMYYKDGLTDLQVEGLKTFKIDVTDITQGFRADVEWSDVELAIALRLHALASSPFRESILLDATKDIISLEDPTSILHSWQFRSSGAVFWPDVKPRNPQNALWEKLQLEASRTPGMVFDSSHLAIDKDLESEMDILFWSLLFTKLPFYVVPGHVETVGVVVDEEHPYGGGSLLEAQSEIRRTPDGNHRAVRYCGLATVQPSLPPPPPSSRAAALPAPAPRRPLFVRLQFDPDAYDEEFDFAQVGMRLELGAGGDGELAFLSDRNIAADAADAAFLVEQDVPLHPTCVSLAEAGDVAVGYTGIFLVIINMNPQSRAAWRFTMASVKASTTPPPWLCRGLRTSARAWLQDSAVTDRFARVPGRGVVEVSGPDTVRFLQGLVTNQMARVERGGDGILAAFLNAQGRMLFDCFIHPRNRGDEFRHPVFLVDCDARAAAPLARHLQRYVLRARVSVRSTTDGEFAVHQAWGPATAAGGGLWGGYVDAAAARGQPPGALVPRAAGFVDVGCRDPRHPDLGVRFIVEDGAKEASPEEYTLRRVLLGVPEGADDIVSGQSLPLESNFDLMSGVDFRKGCYLGQELTIRTYHTGVIRKRIVPVQIYAEGESLTDELVLDTGVNASAQVQGVSPGAEIRLTGGAGPTPRRAEVGRMGTVIHNVGLALVRLEHCHDAAGGGGAEEPAGRGPELVVSTAADVAGGGDGVGAADAGGEAASVAGTGSRSLRVRAFRPGCIRDVKRASRTRARTKDLDQIHEDLKAPEKLLHQPEDPDLPGLGQHYCVEVGGDGEGGPGGPCDLCHSICCSFLATPSNVQCARYFTSAAALEAHVQTKLHKKRLKQLKEEPYTQKEAEAAVGLSTDNGALSRAREAAMDVAATP